MLLYWYYWFDNLERNSYLVLAKGIVRCKSTVIRQEEVLSFWTAAECPSGPAAYFARVADLSSEEVQNRE